METQENKNDLETGESDLKPVGLELPPEKSSRSPAVQLELEKEETEPKEKDPEQQARDQARIQQLEGQMRELLAKNKLSNRIIILLIVLYVLALFFFNNWIFIVILIVPMVALAVFDNRNLRKIQAIQKELRALKEDREFTERVYHSLNDLSKAYTVLDQVEFDGQYYDHIILSPYGVDCISEENNSAELARSLDLPDEDVFWVEKDQPLPDQIDQILSHHEPLLQEKEIFQLLYKLNGIDHE